MKQVTLIRTATISGAIAVAAGALGAHGLEGRITTELLTAFQTGARYHLVHSVVLLVLALDSGNQYKSGFWLITAGILLFSGSLYGLALSSLAGLQLSILGPLTPAGGLLLIAGWLVTGWRAAQIKKGGI